MATASALAAERIFECIGGFLDFALWDRVRCRHKWSRRGWSDLRPQAYPVRRRGQCRFPHSGINANVHNEPPVGTLSCTRRGATAPPSPDATDTYCRPLWV